MGTHQSSMGCGQMWLQTLLCHLLAVQLSFFIGKMGMLQGLDEMTTPLLAQQPDGAGMCFTPA